MSKEVTMIVPPVYLAQLSGVYRIDVGARVVKAYRYDDSISYRVFLARLPKNFITADFLEQVAMIKANAERQHLGNEDEQRFAEGGCAGR